MDMSTQQHPKEEAKQDGPSQGRHWIKNILGIHSFFSRNACCTDSTALDTRTRQSCVCLGGSGRSTQTRSGWVLGAWAGSPQRVSEENSRVSLGMEKNTPLHCFLGFRRLLDSLTARFALLLSPFWNANAASGKREATASGRGTTRTLGRSTLPYHLSHQLLSHTTRRSPLNKSWTGCRTNSADQEEERGLQFSP